MSVHGKRVYPACAGIDRTEGPGVAVGNSLPRMRGDRPLDRFLSMRVERFTPHARGSTTLSKQFPKRFVVYPACAGIDHFWFGSSSLASCLPRMRGDRPECAYLPLPPSEFTPHARGSTIENREIGIGLEVYPACAGIDLFEVSDWFTPIGLPRMRGDRP